MPSRLLPKPPSPKHALPLLTALLLLACSPPRALPPPKVVKFPRPLAAERYAGGIKVGRVSLRVRGAVSLDEAKRFRDLLAKRIEDAFPRVDPKKPPITADLHYAAGYSAHRTIFLDVYAAMSLGLLPFTPQWGYAHGDLQIALRTPAELGVDPEVDLSLYSSQKYSIIFYSWFRNGPLEDAYAAAHGATIDGAIRRLDAWWSSRDGQRWTARRWGSSRRWGGYYGRPRRGRVRFDYDEQGELAAVYGASGWRLITDDSHYEMPEDGPVEPRTAAQLRRVRRPWWKSYLSALSGLEFGYFTGGAWVSSEAKDSLGVPFTIASGEATSKGWKLSLFNPPTKSELFIYPTVGFFSLDIDIADVAGDVPLGQVAGASDVPAVGSDPTTGAPIDLGAPNTYALRLRSGFIGQRVGGTAVWGNKATQLFLTGEGGINLLEWRYTDVRLGRYQESGHSAIFAHSFAGRGLLGLVHRPWHVAGRCELNWEFYRKFGFPRPIPFESRVEYDAAKQAYVRRELKVDAAQVHTVNFFCGVSIVY